MFKMRYLPTLISHLLTLISHLPNTSDVSRKKRSPNRKWVISQLKKLGLLIVFLKLCVGTAELAYGLNHERLTIGITQFPSSSCSVRLNTSCLILPRSFSLTPVT